MGRLTDSPAELAGNYARKLFAMEIYESPLYSAAVNFCENCRCSCDRLTHVPECDFMGCSRCVDEAGESLLREKF